MSETEKNGVPLVVTTEYRGVFFGYGEITEESTIRITNARMCVYWPSENKGVVGLASDGPKTGSRVTPAAPAITLRGITSIMEATDCAVVAWESGIWS